jgi:probable rRNA maturation factor
VKPAALIVECLVPARERAPARRRLALWVDTALGARGAGRELAVQVVSAARMRRLNRQYRGQDRPTNVLAFPAATGLVLQPRPLGDVVICPAVLRREAREQGKAVEAHWAHLVVHGALHLVGYDHQHDRDAACMERREIAVLRRLGFANPYRPVGGAKPQPRANHHD